MSDTTPDGPTSESEDAENNAEKSSNDSSTSHRKWFVAVAAVTALAVGLAAIGLAATSDEETAKSAAVTPAEVGAIKIEALVADNIENKVIGSLSAVGAGFAAKLGLEAGLSFFGYKTQEEKTTEQLKEINGRLDALSNQLTEINSHLNVMSEQIATVGSLVQQNIYQGRSYRVDTAIGEIDDIYVQYKALLCAKGVEAQQQKGIESTGSLYNKDNCSDSGGVKTYEDLFSKKYEGASSSRFQLLHKQVMPAVGSRSILTDFVSVYMGDRKYFTFKDSIVLRNFYTNIAEYAALDAYLQSEYYVMTGQKGAAEKVLSDWYNNNRAEQAIIPPMLPQGFLLMLPNGVGPVGDYPSLMFTAPTWMGPQVPANLPNNNSVSTVQDTPLPSSTQANAFSWNPSIDNTSVDSRVSQSQREVRTRVNRVSMASPHKVGDICGKKTDAAGKLVIYGCVEGTEGYRRAMDTWSQWGTGAGWSLPSSASLKSLWDVVRPLAFADSPDLEARSAGSFGVYAKLPYLVSGIGCTADGNARTVATARAWCVEGPTATRDPSVWTAETQNIFTGSELRDDNYPYVDFTLKCEGGWTAHKKFNLYLGVAQTVGPYTTNFPINSDVFWGETAIDPSWADQAEPVGPVATNEDEKCIFGSLVKAATAIDIGSLNEAGNQKVGLLVNRSLTTAKGDDYMAQNAMSTQWPVIQPTGPSNLGTFFPDPSTALVTWQVPLTNGGAPITLYKVTASPAAGGGTATDCPIVYLKSDGYAGNEAECTGLTAGTRYSFEVTATNSELLSGSAAITGPAAAPATATTVAPTTAVPAVSSTTTTAAPAASTTTAAAGATRDASKNVEAESFDGQCSGCSGVVTKASDGFTSGGYIGGIATGDWVRFDGVNTPVGSDAKFAVRVASGATVTGTIELHADSPTGALLASVPVSNTGGWHTWTTLTAAKQSTLGIRNVYLVFRSGQSGDFVNIDWFKFTA